MKVDRVGMKNIDVINNTKNNTGISFQEVIEKKTNDASLERIYKIISEITESGKQLAQKRTIENLFDYKKKIKAFLDEAVESGLDLDKRGGFRRGGRSRILKIVSKVDDKLMDLTDDMLEGENKRLNLLKIVGEIEGLLLNIYV
ncbi:YaaR family protein [Clostridium sp. D2Q-11]|uniref:YaaR family protein n=1 Tax=Anaeromonas frigoriresistens TaxID=2683708 RepID=A0A942V589_9FIRM|nr:YaaR family protein [Anaeromonas frigoriresistens]